MRRIFYTLSQFAGMQLVLSLTGLIRNKVLTLKLGPAAFGEFTQVITVMSIVYVLVSFGMGVGLSRNAAKSEDHAERQMHLSVANTIVLAFSVISFLAVIIAMTQPGMYASCAIGADDTTKLVLVILCVAIPFEALKNNYIAFLQGILDIKGLASKRSIAVILATIVSIPIVWVFGIIGAAVQFLLLSLLLTLMLHLRCRSLGYFPLKLYFNKKQAYCLCGFGLVSLTSGFSQSFVDAAIRADIIKAAGVSDNGILQAGLVLSQTVKTIILGSIGSFALASIAKYKDPAEISHSLDQLLKVVLPVAVCVLGTLGILSIPTLWCLYSPSFVSANQYFPFMLAGDLMVTFSWVIGSPMLAAGDLVLWLCFNIFYDAGRWLIASGLIPHVKASGFVYSYFIAALIQMLLILYFFRKRYSLQLHASHYCNLALGTVLIIVLAKLGIQSSESPIYAAAGLMLVTMYTCYFAYKYEIFRKLQDYMRGRQ